MRRSTFLGVGLIVLLALPGLPRNGSADEKYTVKKGDSLYGIARRFKIPIDVLRKTNGLSEDRLDIHQVVLIPGKKGPDAPRHAPESPSKKASEANGKKPSAPIQKGPGEHDNYVVRPGDTIYGISKRVGIPSEEIMRANRLSSPALRAGQRLALTKAQRPEEPPETEELGDTDNGNGGPSVEADLSEREGASAPGKWQGLQERNLLVRVVKTFLGAPYRLGGYTVRGLDCSAFVKRIYQIFNVDLPRTAREQLRIGKGVNRGDLEEGDLVFFKTRYASGAHVGIYIGNNEFIHASSRSREVKIDSLNAPYFSQRFLRGVRVKELDGEI